MFSHNVLDQTPNSNRHLLSLQSDFQKMIWQGSGFVIRRKALLEFLFLQYLFNLLHLVLSNSVAVWNVAPNCITVNIHVILYTCTKMKNG